MADKIHATIPSACKVCGCDNRSRRVGYCSISCANKGRTDHSTATLMQRFWAKVDKTPGHGPQGECWHWTARLDGRGYGEIKVAGKYRKAHRLSLFGRDSLDDPRLACHRCDNPKCVNPRHLFAGDPADNVHDMHAKGRSPLPRRKLTEAQVREIRTSGAQGKHLALSFGVDEMVISRIRRGLAYRGVAP